MNYPMKDVYKEIEWFGKNGFDFIDLTLEPPKASADKINPNKVKQLLKKYNLGIIGHTDASVSILSPFASFRNASQQELIKSIKVFSKIGVKKVTVHLMPLPRKLPRKTALKYYVSLLKKVVNEAKKKKITVMGESCYGSEEHIKLIEDVLAAVPGLKFHLDVGHTSLLAERPSFEKFMKKFHSKLEHVHISENDGNADQHLPLLSIKNSSWEWKKIIKTLKKYKYDKTITLEIFSEDRHYLLHSRDKFKQWWNEC
ncbi:sugar phosphate isomerase/epimerase [Candidatus Woesearchaeota archaeon]|nr:sugar phosphate isomerase/epimerase [Candidatus Woesearchaeota archaeon]